MSRVGKHAVNVPEGVNVAISGNAVSAKGKLGELSQEFDTSSIQLKVKASVLTVTPVSSDLMSTPTVT